MSTLVDEIRSYVVTAFLDGEDTSDLTPDFDLIANGVVDSLGLVRVVSHLSSAYAIPVDDIPLKPEHFRSIAAIAAFVESADRAVV
ncbi:acyl carrier protein [Streptomyces longwoodensis]|uniref:acyl carrier protein n=1 Tax=Streptomyces longwoodensis TaxID=68231 RepID=UPI003402ED28